MVTLPDDAIVFDLETTGFSPDKDEIIEIAALRIENNSVTHNKVFHTLVRPKRGIPWFVTRLHGITGAMVRNAPTLEEVLPEFFGFVASHELIAHNAGFDTSFLEAAATRLGLKAPNPPTHCTMVLSRLAFPGERRHNLDSLCERLGLETSTRHRALADAELTAHAFVRLKMMLSAKRA